MVGSKREGSTKDGTQVSDLGSWEVPFMKLRKGNRFRLEDYEFSYRHFEFEMPGFTQRMSGRQLDKGL